MVMAPRLRAKGAVAEEVTAITGVEGEERRESWVANWPVIVEPPQIRRYSFSSSGLEIGTGFEVADGRGTSSQCQSVIAAVRPATPRQAADVKSRDFGRGRTVCAGTVM